jgi:hypothetical protein
MIRIKIPNYLKITQILMMLKQMNRLICGIFQTLIKLLKKMKKK